MKTQAQKAAKVAGCLKQIYKKVSDFLEVFNEQRFHEATLNPHMHS